jgi:hypothetical protein
VASSAAARLLTRMKTAAELLNPTAGESVTSACGMIELTLQSDGTLLIKKLANQRGSFNLQLFYDDSSDPDVIVFRMDDPPIPPYLIDSSRTLVKIRILMNPV